MLETQKTDYLNRVSFRSHAFVWKFFTWCKWLHLLVRVLHQIGRCNRFHVNSSISILLYKLNIRHLKTNESPSIHSGKCFVSYRSPFEIVAFISFRNEYLLSGQVFFFSEGNKTNSLPATRFRNFAADNAAVKFWWAERCVQCTFQFWSYLAYTAIRTRSRKMHQFASSSISYYLR